MENNTANTNNFLNWVEIKNFTFRKDLRSVEGNAPGFLTLERILNDIITT